MKKTINFLITVVLVIILSSCDVIVGRSRIKGRNFFHNYLNFMIIDEYNKLDSDYRVEEITTANGYKSIEYKIYNSNDELLDSIDVSKYTIRLFRIIGQYIYVIVDDAKYGVMKYGFAKVGDGQKAFVDMNVVDDSKVFLTINGVKFYNDINFMCEAKYYITQAYNNFFTSIYDEKAVYNITLYRDTKTIEMVNYYDERIRYTYPFSKELSKHEFRYYSNDHVNFGLNKAGREDIAQNEYELLNNRAKVINEKFYFAYARYLGEHELSECRIMVNCCLSSIACEILMFNNETKTIERVALLPPRYNLLAIYEEYAVIMNNKCIARYNYKTGDIDNIVNIDIAGEVCDKEYEDRNAIIYLQDMKFSKLEVIYSNR